MNTNSDAVQCRTVRALTALEGCVLGVLVEKQHIVPDAYPLMLNALTVGRNQKVTRAPAMSVTKVEILTTIGGLETLSSVMEGSSNRASRFEHNTNRVLGVSSQPVALLTVLPLRDSQTAVELRLNAARLYAFVDISSVEAFLDELAERDPSYAVKLSRMPSERRNRWTHLLCGEVAQADIRQSGGVDESTAPPEFEALKAEQKQLADKVARLQAPVEQMAGELGISVDKSIL